MLKLPFIKRERYVVLKAVTHNLRTLEESPIVKTSRVKPKGQCPADRFTTNFSTCLGWIKTQRQSITLPMWTEVEFGNYLDGNRVLLPPDSRTQIQQQPADPIYALDSDTALFKMLPPWLIEANKDVDFLMTKHMLNSTPMDVVSGLVAFRDFVYGPNVFFKLRTFENYKVHLGTPLVSMHPITDLPVHVECYCDPQRFALLNDSMMGVVPHFRASGIKTEQAIKRKDNGYDT